MCQRMAETSLRGRRNSTRERCEPRARDTPGRRAPERSDGWRERRSGAGYGIAPAKRALPARRSKVVGGERARPLNTGSGRSAASVRAVRERLDEPVQHRAGGAVGIFTLEAVSRAGEDDHLGADVLLLECLMDDLAVADV